jgi:hypothetical protein
LRPKKQREELEQSISNVERAQQRQAERKQANLQNMESRAANKAQDHLSGSTLSRITRSMRKHIDQSSNQLQSILESTRQSGFLKTLVQGSSSTMPLPRTPVPAAQPPKSSTTSACGGRKSKAGRTRPGTPASNRDFSDNEAFIEATTHLGATEGGTDLGGSNTGKESHTEQATAQH